MASSYLFLMNGHWKFICPEIVIQIYAFCLVHICCSSGSEQYLSIRWAEVSVKLTNFFDNSVLKVIDHIKEYTMKPKGWRMKSLCLSNIKWHGLYQRENYGKVNSSSKFLDNKLTLKYLNPQQKPQSQYNWTQFHTIRKNKGRQLNYVYFDSENVANVEYLIA